MTLGNINAHVRCCHTFSSCRPGTRNTGSSAKASRHEDTRGSGGMAPPFLTSTLDGGEWSASGSCLLIPGNRAVDTQETRRWVGPRFRVDAVTNRGMLHRRQSNPGPQVQHVGIPPPVGACGRSNGVLPGNRCSIPVCACVLVPVTSWDMKWTGYGESVGRAGGCQTHRCVHRLGIDLAGCAHAKCTTVHALGVLVALSGAGFN
jgi:hypothetical protein